MERMIATTDDALFCIDNVMFRGTFYHMVERP